MQIRDEVHGIIELFPHEKRIVETKMFQRLRWVSQLSLCKLVFPGATHTRFSHSLGAMHLAGIYAKHITDDPHCPMTNDRKRYFTRLVRIAALLHDLAHGPFSHSFDVAVYKKAYPNSKAGHDEHLDYVLNNFPEVRKALYDADIFVADVLNVLDTSRIGNLQKRGYPSRIWTDAFCVAHNIVKGPLGADRMDFLLRDAYHCGTSHFGVPAVQRLIGNSSMIKMSDSTYRLHYDVKVAEDVFQMLSSRSFMYSNVYLHKISLACEMFLAVALRWADDAFKWNEEVLWDEDKFCLLTDGVLDVVLHVCRESKDPHAREAYEAAEKLLHRRIPKIECELVSTNVKTPISTIDDKGNVRSSKITSRAFRCSIVDELVENKIYFWDKKLQRSVTPSDAIERANLNLKVHNGLTKCVRFV
jgi:HD superfamily phosphohydrolase